MRAAAIAHSRLRMIRHLLFLLATTLLGTALFAQEESPAPTSVPTQISEYPGAPLEDRHGNLWFSTVFRGIVRYDGEKFVDFTTEDGLLHNGLRGSIEDRHGNLWFATRGGLNKYDGKTFSAYIDYEEGDYTYDGFGEFGDHRELWDVFIDRKDTLWIATLDGVFRHDGKQFVHVPMPAIAAEGDYEFTPKMVYCIREAANGDLWFGTDGAGAVRYDGKTMTRYTVKEHGLASDRICEILEDQRGNTWFGTSGGGISRYDGKEFTTHLRRKTHSIHVGWGRYMSILEDKAGDVWFGVSDTGGGVYRYDGEKFHYLGAEQGLGDGGVPSIRADRKGQLWFGTTAGVYRYDGKRFINFTREDA